MIPALNTLAKIVPVTLALWLPACATASTKDRVSDSARRKRSTLCVIQLSRVDAKEAPTAGGGGGTDRNGEDPDPPGGSRMAGHERQSRANETIRGPNVDFHVITNPPGATVTTDLMTPESRRESERLQYLVRTGVLDDVGDVDVVHYACESTPCEFELSRRSNFTLVVEREGYHTATVEVTERKTN